jgi:Universal stress protein UspA and related nucleotide-binding proteins
MKILIGYDGSACSDSAFDDLQAAGLPADAEAVVISVAEAWLPPPPEGVSVSDHLKNLQTEPQPFAGWTEGAKAVTDAETLANRGAERLRANFPGWNVSAQATYGSPGWEIVAKADEVAADLVVVGSQGLNALERMFLGSISQKVLAEAHCSVRVARGRNEVDAGPSRIVIGFDGSEGSHAAVNAVAARNWPAGTEAKLVSASDMSFGLDISMMPAAELADGGEWLRDAAGESISSLEAAGLATEFVHEIGSPKNVLVDVAESWHANSIFVGANRWGSAVERFMLGSVSAAIAARAHCSVEIVRKRAL